MKTVLSFVALFGSALAQWNHEIHNEHLKNLDFHNDFAQFKEKYELTYSAEEEPKRFALFSQTLVDIAQYNSENHGSRVRANRFAVLTDEEFKDQVLGGDSCLRDIPHAKAPVVHVDYPETGDDKDWAKEGCITDVKFQESCGSCWAFSTTGAVECAMAIKQSGGGSCVEKPLPLSEQQLVDCDWLDHGCNGGSMILAMEYLHTHTGLCSETDYPYTAVGGTCNAWTCGDKYGHLSGSEIVTQYSEPALREALDKTCVSVGVQADQFAFKYYSSGVMDGTCTDDMNHGVLAVGYGNEDGKDFWKIKNSWSTDWGDQGFIKLCRNCGKNGKAGQCGILFASVFPKL